MSTKSSGSSSLLRWLQKKVYKDPRKNKSTSANKRTAEKWFNLLSGKGIPVNGTDLMGRRGQMMTWYPSIGMVLRNKHGHITTWDPATETEDCDIVTIGRSDPEWTKDAR